MIYIFKQRHVFINMLKKNEKKAILLLVILAFILRIGFVLIVHSHDGTSHWSDDLEYLSMGRQIAAGSWNPKVSNALPLMQVGPGLPMLIAFSIVVFDNPVWPIYLYNAIITSLVVWVLFYLGKLLFGRKVGWLVAMWGVLYPDFIRYCPHLLKEPTIYFFFPLTVYLLIKSIKNNGQIRPLIFSALSYIWLIHTDERYLMYAPLFVLVFVFIKPFDLKKIVNRAGLWAIATLVLLTPWTIHNYQIFKQVVLISPRTTAITAKLWGKNIMGMKFDQDAPHLLQNYQEAFKNGKMHDMEPRRYGKIEMYLRAFINFWQPTYFRPTFIQNGFQMQKWSLRHNLFGLFFYGIFLPFYILGLFMLIKNKNGLGLFLAFIPILHSVVHALMVWPLERYRSPVVFCVVCVGIWSMIGLARHFVIKNTASNKEQIGR